MEIISTVAAARALPRGKMRVLVPTMGALHRGHGELMQIARAHAGSAGQVAVSIFVNPLQFEPGADYERYPRPKKADEDFCRAANVDLIFRPPPAEMYAADRSTFIDETALATKLEGKARPGHFRGVCTVVAKLFNILAPNAAVFGEKDFQQLAIIQRMVRDLNFPVEIIAAPTVREEDGLACSSRNQYLNTDERKQASVLRRALLSAQKKVEAGETSAPKIVDLVRAEISSAPLARIGYVDLVDAENFETREVVRPNSLLAVAVFFGKTRLIDNILLP